MSVFRTVRFKVIAFVGAIALFVAFGVAVFIEQKEATNRLVVSFPTTMWALNKVELDHGRFARMVTLYRNNAASYDDLMLAFDILWSRIDISLASEEARLPRQMVNVRSLLDQMKAALEVTEPQLANLPSGDSEDIREIERRFLAFQGPLSRVSVEYFSSSSTQYRASVINRIFNKLAFYFVGLVLSGLALILLLLREIKDSRYHASHDSLTLLPNRNYFNQELELAVKRADEQRQTLTVFVLDLNDFKQVNDQLGHRAGDELLQEVARRLLGASGGKNFVARLGGDEFAVIVQRYVSENEALALARQLLTQIARPVTVKDGKWDVQLSIGLGRKEPGVGSAEDLLFEADMAMYHVKQQGHGGIALCDEALQNRMKRIRQIEADLKSLLNNSFDTQEMYLCFQPIMSADDSTVFAVEALLRWNHPQLGMLSPIEVVEVAEAHGLGVRLGEWVLMQTCDIVKQFQQELAVTFKVSVNVAPSMYRDGLLQCVERAVSLSGIKPSQIILEVTENTAIADLGGDVEVLHQLRDLGVSLALDDFGTGLSSLSYLNSMPFDIVKLDRFFVSQNDEENHQAILASTLTLAKSYSLKVVAEGLENDELLDHLRANNCDYFQGYYFAKPLTQEQLYQKIEGGELHCESYLVD